MPFPQITSGGQTGADRAALDWAMKWGQTITLSVYDTAMPENRRSYGLTPTLLDCQLASKRVCQLSVNLVKQREIIEAFAEASETGDPSQINRTWSRFFYDLQGARGIFVVNDPNYDKPLLPMDAFFADKCNLVALLKSRQLVLIQNRDSNRPFTYNCYIFADTNFVSYCNTVYSGKSLGANADAFYAAGDYLMTKRDRLEAMCYKIENFERRHTPQVKNSLSAFVAFKFADADVFRRTRTIRPTISNNEVEQLATQEMATLETSDFKTVYETMKLSYLLNRVLLTKSAIIEFSSGHRKSAKQKYLMLLEYFHNEVTMLPQIELIVAWRFYELKSQEPFFKMIQRNASDLLGSIRSMSWDLAHWRNAMTLVTALSHLGIYANMPIPYLLTFDQGFASLLRQFQLKGIILLGDGMRYIAVPDSQYLRSYSDVLEDAEHLLTSAAAANRQQRRPAINKLEEHYERLAQANSQELAKILAEKN